MSLRSPTDNENGIPPHSITLQTLTPIQTSPVEGEGSAPPVGDCVAIRRFFGRKKRCVHHRGYFRLRSVKNADSDG